MNLDEATFKHVQHSDYEGLQRIGYLDRVMPPSEIFSKDFEL